MSVEPLRVAVGRDHAGWDERFAEALQAHVEQGAPLEYAIVDLGAYDWIERVAPYDAILWNPQYMGPFGASQFKEKVYFLEQFLGKRVCPNYRSVWHYESKFAQSYVFETEGVPTPATFVSFDHEEAWRIAQHETYPVVAKKSFGAASQNVRLLRSSSEARRFLDEAFFQELWDVAKASRGAAGAALSSVTKRWFWAKVLQRLLGRESVGSAYWQEFVAGNDADLRVTVVGSRAVGFWRKNREGDFRASGSGRIDYETPVPTDVVAYLFNLSQRLGFDSMAYDIVFREGGFVVLEMSYDYIDRAVYAAPGCFERDEEGVVTFLEGHVWPEQLWVDRVLAEHMTAVGEENARNA
jgi:glutathione synthase/RimK-type ligase-like ATP-grasp enzyme